MSALVILGIELPARDPQALASFYCEALDFRRIREDRDGIELELAGCILRLRAAPGGRAMPAGSRSHDRWFRHIAIVVRDMAAACQRIDALHAARISAEAQTLPAWNREAAGIEALYFRDPEGHPLELIRFPPDKGRPQWHRPGDDLFQGVDHSAIVVADTDASALFYRNLAGLSPIAEAHNHGREQERLSGVAGANLRVTTLADAQAKPDIAPHLELLEYRMPRDAQPMPPDTGDNDAWAARTIFSRPESNGSASPDAKGLLDPDGHRVLIP